MPGSLIPAFDGVLVGTQTIVTAPFSASEFQSLVADLLVRSTISDGVVVLDVNVQHANDLTGDDWATLATFTQAALTAGGGTHETISVDFSSTPTMALIRFSIALSDASASGIDFRITAVARGDA